MIERRFGRIVQVASMAGLIAGAPGTALYAGAKAFLIRFAQSIHLETKEGAYTSPRFVPASPGGEFRDVGGTREALGRTPAWMWREETTRSPPPATGGRGQPPDQRSQAPENKTSYFALAKLLPDEWLLGSDVPPRGERMRGGLAP